MRPLPRRAVIIVALLGAAACRKAPAPPPTLAQVADSLLRTTDQPGCAEIAREAQDSLTVAGHRPAMACRWVSGDTTTVVLREADSSVVSIVRVWAPLNLTGEYEVSAARLDRLWGPGEPCPANDQKGVRGDRFYRGAGFSVRLFVRLPGTVVEDYEVGPASCRPGR